MGANSSKHSSVADQLTAAILRGDARFVQSIASKEIKRGFPFLHTAVIASHQSSNHELLQLILCLMSANGEPGDVFKLEKIVDQRRSEDGATPLMLACELGDATAATLLVEYGADMRLRDKKYGRTCLHYAILANKPHMVPLLVAKEQERSQRQSQRKDSLALFKRISDSMTGHSATDDENVPFIDLRARSSFTGLMYACFFNFPDCVTVLMQNGAQYKLRRGDHGRGILPDPSCSCYLPYASSALHIAALRGNYDACWALLSAYFNSLSPVWIADGYRTNALEIGVTRIDPRLLADSVRRTPFEIARQMDLFNLLPLLNPVTPISVALDDRELRLMGPLSLKKIAASVAQAVLLDQVAALASQLLAMKEKKDKKRVEKQGQAETEGGKTSAMVDMSHLDHSNNPMGQDLLALSGPFVLPSPVSQHQRLDDMLHLQMSFSDILVQQERRLAAMMTQMLAPPPPNRTSLIQIPESSAELSGAFVEENGSNPSQFISGAASPHHLPTAQSPTWHANTTFKKDSQPMGSSPVQCSSPPYYTSSEVPYKPSQAELQQHIYGALMALVSGADENEDDVIEEHHENEETEPELEEREAAEEAWEEEEEEEEITGWLEGGGGGGGAGKKKATTTTTAGNHLDKTLAAARSHRLVHGVNTSNLFGLNLLSITAPAPAVQDSPLPSPSPAGPGANTSILRLSHKSMDATSGRSSMLRQRLNHALSSQPPSPSASQSQLSASAAEDACGVCFDEGNGFISILPCNHKICCPCAKELIYLHPTDPIPCPFCRGLVRGFEL